MSRGSNSLNSASDNLNNILANTERIPLKIHPLDRRKYVNEWLTRQLTNNAMYTWFTFHVKVRHFYDTVVGENINIMKTTFDLNFEFDQAWIHTKMEANRSCQLKKFLFNYL